MTYLDVSLIEEPGPVGQNLVDVPEPPELEGRPVEALQPGGIPARGEELGLLLDHQVFTAVSGACLQQQCQLIATNSNAKIFTRRHPQDN